MTAVLDRPRALTPPRFADPPRVVTETDDQDETNQDVLDGIEIPRIEWLREESRP